MLQLVNHGISEELLQRVKKVCSDCYKLEREEGFKNSTPVKLLNELVEKKSYDKLENLDWEDVFLLSDDNEWPSKTTGFKYVYSVLVLITSISTEKKTSPLKLMLSPSF